MLTPSAREDPARDAKRLLGRVREYTPSTRRAKVILAGPLTTDQRIEVTHPPSGWRQLIAAIWSDGRLVPRAARGDLVEVELRRPAAAGSEILNLSAQKRYDPPRRPKPAEGAVLETLKRKRSRGGG